MKTCQHCGATEWPCFLVDTLCRMCRARCRDERHDACRVQEKTIAAKEPQI